MTKSSPRENKKYKNNYSNKLSVTVICYYHLYINSQVLKSVCVTLDL